MFELEASLQVWKDQLRQRKTLLNEDIEELEQHVRDSIAAHRDSGLTEEESFWVAIGRVGEFGPLAHEFGKINGGHIWAQHMFWLLAGFLLFEVCRLTIQAVGSLGQTLAAAVGGNGIVMGWVAAGLTCAGWGAVLLLLYRSGGSRGGPNLIGRFIANTPGKTIGACVGAALIVTSALWAGSWVLTARLVTPYDLGQAALISSYMSVLLAALIPLACLLAMIAIRRRLSGFYKLER